MKFFKKPLFNSQYHLSERTDVRSDLIVGAVLFGVGWSISGHCPGPPLVVAMGGSKDAFVTALTQIVGSFVCRYVADPKRTIWNVGTLHFVVLIFIYSFFGILRDVSEGYTRDHIMTLSFADEELQRIVVGGLMMGAGVILLLFSTGYALGIAGLFSRSMAPQMSDRGVKIGFVYGFVLAGIFLRFYEPKYLIDNHNTPVIWNIIGSLMVSGKHCFPILLLLSLIVCQVGAVSVVLEVCLSLVIIKKHFHCLVSRKWMYFWSWIMWIGYITFEIPHLYGCVYDIRNHWRRNFRGIYFETLNCEIEFLINFRIR